MIGLFKKQIPLVVLGVLFVIWSIMINPTYNATELKEYSGVCIKIDYSGPRPSSAYLTMDDGKVFYVHHTVKDKVRDNGFTEDTIQSRNILYIKFLAEKDSYTAVEIETENKVYLTLRDWEKTLLKHVLHAVGLAIFINLIYFLGSYDHYRMNRPKKKKSKKKPKQQIKKRETT